MLELGRVDFEVTLTLCRWEWGSCAPWYVPARFNSDGGSSFPRLISPPLFQHHSFKDSTSLSKTHLSTILPPLRIIYLLAVVGCKVFIFGFILWKCKEVTFLNSDFPIGETIWQGKGSNCKYGVTQYWWFRDIFLFVEILFLNNEDHWGMLHTQMRWIWQWAGCAALPLMAMQETYLMSVITVFDPSVL